MTSGILPSIQIVVLDLFCCHPISYISNEAFSFCSYGFSHTKQSDWDTAVSGTMAGKEIKLDEPAFSGNLVADTDSESSAEASDLEDEFHEFKEQEASAQEDEPQAATSGRGSPT